MVYRDEGTGKLLVTFSRGEIEELLEHWRQKPETKDMIAKIAEERRDFVSKVIAEIKSRNK